MYQGEINHVLENHSIRCDVQRRDADTIVHGRTTYRRVPKEWNRFRRAWLPVTEQDEVYSFEGEFYVAVAHDGSEGGPDDSFGSPSQFGHD